MSAETAAAHFHCKQMTLKVVMCHASGEERKTEEGRTDDGEDAARRGDTPKKRLIVYAEECCEHNPGSGRASLPRGVAQSAR